MKHRWVAIIFLALLLFFSLPVYAHPGRTDGNGGHANHSTGEYHYHHGYGEHQHYDIDGDGVIDCPYDFNDNTDYRNNNSNSQATKKGNTKAVTDVSRIISESVRSAHKAQQKAKVTAKDIVGIILVIVLCYTPGVYLITVVFSGISELIGKLVKRDIKMPDALGKIFLVAIHIFYVVTVSILMLRNKGLL